MEKLLQRAEESDSDPQYYLKAPLHFYSEKGRDAKVMDIIGKFFWLDQNFYFVEWALRETVYPDNIKSEFQAAIRGLKNVNPTFDARNLSVLMGYSL